MDCNIYGARGGGSPMMRAKLLSPEMAGVMREAGGNVRDVYAAIVAHGTGALARSAKVTLGVGGQDFDRICADVTVGEGTPRGGYGAAHEFGIGGHPGSRVPATRWMPQAGANDLVKALAIVNSM